MAQADENTFLSAVEHKPLPSLLLPSVYLLGTTDGDGLALGESFVAILVVGVGELANLERTRAVVGKQWHNSLDRAASLALDLNVDTVAVQLAVANGVVPDPLEGGLARGRARGDLDIHGIVAAVGDAAEAVADDGVDHDPGLAVVVGQGPLTVATTVSGANLVLGLDRLAGLVDGALGLDPGVLANGLADVVVSANGRGEVIVDGLAGGRGRAAGITAVAGAGAAHGNVSLGQGGESSNGGDKDGGLEEHFWINDEVRMCFLVG